jgi:hypothetical protein
MDHLDHRCEAVCGAGRRRDDPVPRRVVDVVVDAEDDIGRVAVLDRGADHDLLHAGREIGRERRLRLEDAGAVDHHVDTVERQVGQVAGADERQARAVDASRCPRHGQTASQRPWTVSNSNRCACISGIAHGIVDPCDSRPTLQQRLQRQLPDAAQAR